MTLAWIAGNDAFEASEFDALRSLPFKVTRGAAGPGAPLRRENENTGQLAQEEMRWMAVAPRPSSTKTNSSPRPSDSRLLQMARHTRSAGPPIQTPLKECFAENFFHV